MKKLFSFCAGVLAVVSSLSQATLDYNLRIIDNQGKPLSNASITLLETTSKDRRVLKTNSAGQVSFTLDSGKEWAVSVKDMKNCEYIDMPKGKGSGSSMITYDMTVYNRENRPPVDRSTMRFAIKDQTRLNPKSPDSGHSLVHIKLVRKDRKPLANYALQLTCYKTSTMYTGKTSGTGMASFLVPVDQDYEIDIDGIETFSWIDLSSRPSTQTVTLVYEPTNIVEKESNGYVIQTIPKDVRESSARSRVRIKVNGGEHNGVQEDVYLRMLKSNKVYKGKTGQDGTVTFMLPVKHKYMIDFNFLKDVDVIDLSRVKGLSWYEKSVHYIPDPRLQHPESFIPRPGDLVLKEFNDFVDKQYPDPETENIDFYIKWGNKVGPNSKEALMEIGFKSKSKIPKISKPINVAFVIDKSGSMAGYDRIESLKSSLIRFIERLSPNDIVSVIAFDTESRILINGMRAGEKQHLKDVIESIEADGGTNIYNGMVDGYEQVLKNLNPGGTNRVILLTDGYGTTEPAEIVAKSKSYNVKGIELSAVGVGSGYNQALLSQLATAGGGLMHYSGSAEDIDRVFSEELSSILYPIAKTARLDILYNDKIVYRQLYGYPVSEKSEGKVALTMDNLYPGLNKMALVKFDLHEPTREIVKQPVTLRLTYYDLSKDKEIVTEKKVHPEWEETTGELDMILDKQQKKLYAIAVLNQSLKVMAESFEANDYLKAKNTVDRALVQIKQLFPEAEDADIKKLVDEMHQYASAFDQISVNKQRH